MTIPVHVSIPPYIGLAKTKQGEDQPGRQQQPVSHNAQHNFKGTI
jgi:hypothetical protein